MRCCSYCPGKIWICLRPPKPFWVRTIPRIYWHFSRRHNLDTFPSQRFCITSKPAWIQQHQRKTSSGLYRSSFLFLFICSWSKGFFLSLKWTDSSHLEVSIFPNYGARRYCGNFCFVETKWWHEWDWYHKSIQMLQRSCFWHWYVNSILELIFWCAVALQNVCRSVRY